MKGPHEGIHTHRSPPVTGTEFCLEECHKPALPWLRSCCCGSPGSLTLLLSSQLQSEGGSQQGGARNPGVLQSQGEAGGVSRRVSRGRAWSAAFCGSVGLCWSSSCRSSPSPGMSPWSCLLFSCTPSPMTTSPFPDPSQVSTLHPEPHREGLRQGQWGNDRPSSTHSPTLSLCPSAPRETDVPVDTNLIEFDTK